MSVGMDKYLNDILTKIYTNQNLCKYLYYDARNPLSLPNLANPQILRTDKANQRLFVTPFSVDTADITKTTLTIMLDKFSIDEDNQYYEDFTIDFIVACNVRLWEIEDGSNEVKLRVNGIWEELNQLFKRQSTVGIGKNHFDYGRIQKYNNYFWGYTYCLSGKQLPKYSNIGG